MKFVILTIVFTLFSFAGFFNETAASDKAEYLENDRLCKMFTKKVEDYKKTMRADFLAETTLASYEHRASLFCKKADNIKDELTPDVLTELNVTTKTNTPEINTTDINQSTSIKS